MIHDKFENVRRGSAAHSPVSGQRLLIQVADTYLDRLGEADCRNGAFCKKKRKYIIQQKKKKCVYIYIYIKTQANVRENLPSFEQFNGIYFGDRGAGV